MQLVGCIFLLQKKKYYYNIKYYLINEDKTMLFNNFYNEFISTLTNERDVVADKKFQDPAHMLIFSLNMFNRMLSNAPDELKDAIRKAIHRINQEKPFGMDYGMRLCESGMNAFHHCARYELKYVLKYLIKLEIEGLDEPDKYGATPLVYAINSGSYKAANMLIKNGALLDKIVLRSLEEELSCYSKDDFDDEHEQIIDHVKLTHDIATELMRQRDDITRQRDDLVSSIADKQTQG